MRLDLELHGDVAVITVPGPALDTDSAPLFRREILPLLEGRARVLLDLGALRFVDSAGLGALLACLRVLSGHGGDLRLCGVVGPVRQLVELVRLHKIVEVHESRAAALASW